MSPDEFWEMTPQLFFLKEKGYYRRENRAGYYFREQFALTFNANRSEKDAAIEGTDVLMLPGEKKKRASKARKRIVFTPEEIARIEQLHNQPTLIIP